jgi:intracellular septation protein
MKILIDFFPILLFFGAYKLYDIYIGTGVLMAATVLQMALIYGIGFLDFERHDDLA